MKTITSGILALIAAAAAVFVLSACDEGKSYAELLSEEDMYVNNFLADQRVALEIPADTVFISGPDAPFYRIDDDGMLYMQVLDPGTPGNKVTNDEQIYFRYTRYGLAAYKNGKLPGGEGNNISLNPCWFRYDNFSIQGSYQWGVGIQRPLRYLPIDCQVRLVVKSQMGISNETTDVQPYLWDLTYERRK